MGQVTISGTSVTVFGSLDGANAYFNVSLGSEVWAAASSTNKQKGLVSATRWMQRLGLVDENGDEIEPTVDDSGVPEGVQNGCYELALVVLTDSSAPGNATTGSNVKSVKAGTTQVDFFRQTDGAVLPTVAMQLLRPYLSSINSSSSGAAGCASGTGEDSTFADIDAWGRTEGFP